MRSLLGLSATPLALILAACGGGGSPTAAVSPTSLAGKYYGTYNDPDGVPRQAWLQIEAEPDEAGRYRTILTVYPGTERFLSLPQSYFGSSVLGASSLDGSTLRFSTPGAVSSWVFSGSSLLQPAGPVDGAGDSYIDASFPQKLSAQAATIDEATTIVRRTYEVPGLTIHLQIVVPPPEKSAARLPPVPH